MKKFIASIANRMAAWATDKSSNILEDMKIRHTVIDLDVAGSPLTITFHNATGGKVVQTSRYNRINGNHQGNLYILHDTDDIGEQLSMIITRESIS